MRATLEGLVRQAIDSGIEPAMAFAKRQGKYLRGILASTIFPLNTSVLEGVNNRVKVIKRMPTASGTPPTSS